MQNRLKRFYKILILLLVIPGLIAITPIESQSKAKKSTTSVKKKTTTKKKKKKKSYRRKRSYNPEKTRNEATEFIRNNSAEISALAGLDPNIDSISLRQQLNENSLTSDEEFFEEGENIAELELEDDVEVDIESFKVLWLSYVEDEDINAYTIGGIKKKDIMDAIMDWLGTPYHFGGSNNKGIDCSAFVQTIFNNSAHISLPRTAREQCTVGLKIKKSELEFGDLVFFHTYSRSFASHVGIYLGDDLFAHSSSRYGVTVSSLESTFYNKRFIGGKRLSSRDVVKLSNDSESNLNNSH